MVKTKVLVVDDSALGRGMLVDIINHEADMEVIGAAPDPARADEMIRALAPDVLTLDVETAGAVGLDFLQRLMRLRPMPVVMVSSLTARGSETALRALELGAIDFVAKPNVGNAAKFQESAQAIVVRIRAAAAAHVRRAAPIATLGLGTLPPDADCSLSAEQLIVVGASTGGTEALRELLMAFPPGSPAVLVAQHMPAGFTRSFAQRLDTLCRIRVKEAEHGERVLGGHAYIAPGSHHLRLVRIGASYQTALSDEPPVNRHRPSVDVLFRSAARVAGKNAIGVMLTGMGKDGAAAMLEMRQAGAYNFAQDEASCVVFGMPREAIALSAVDEVVPLKDIAARLFARLGGGGAGRAPESGS